MPTISLSKPAGYISHCTACWHCIAPTVLTVQIYQLEKLSGSRSNEARLTILHRSLVWQLLCIARAEPLWARPTSQVQCCLLYINVS